MPSRGRIALVFTSLVLLVGCDQRTKALAQQHLRSTGTKSFLDDTFRLEYVENPGAFLSLGANLPSPWRKLLFTIVCSAGIAGVLLYTLYASERGVLQTLALSMICAGGIGNLLDRWMQDGSVRDFLNVGFGPLRTGVFNLADVTLITGCSVLILRSVRTRRL